MSLLLLFNQSTSGAAQILHPALFADADTFFGATISGHYTISAGFFADADTFFGGVITGGAAAADQYTVSGRTVQDLFSPSGMSYPSHVTRQTN